MKTQSYRRTTSKPGAISRWFSLILIWIIVISVVFWFIVSVAQIPHARTLASAYAAASDCSPAKLLPNAPPPSALRGSTAAPAQTLCVVQPMTVVKKEYTSSRSYHSYDVLLSDEAGTRYYVIVDDDSVAAWRHLRATMKVNVQMVQGNVALIANGTEIAQTQDQPQVKLHDLYLRTGIFGAFMVPIVAVVVSVVKRRSKKRQPHAPPPFSRPV